MTLNIFKTIQRFRKNRKGFSLIEISVVILIIGVLIAGISQASDMIDDSALKGARTASRGSRVPRIKDLVLWLDATADGASLASASSAKQAVDGDAVTVWKDSNPNSSSKFTLAGTSTFSSNKVGGLPGIALSVLNSNFFKLTDRFDNSTGEYTIYLIYQPVALPASGTVGVIMEKRNATSAIFPYRLEIDSNGFYRYSNSNNFVLYGSKKASAGNIDLIRISRSSAGAVALEVDSSPATGNSLSVIRNNDELIIGAQNGTSISNYVNGRIGEVIIYERDLAPSEKTDVESYLYKKWKLKKETSAVLGSCSIPASATNVAVSSVPVGGTTVPCVAGYTGGVTFTCAAAGSAAAVTSGTCAAGCVIDSSTYIVASGNYTIAAGATSVVVTCKTGSTQRSASCPAGGGSITYSGSCP
jgi:prepilin-type N-terminal cleavage/methylation domain-containing protein